MIVLIVLGVLTDIVVLKARKYAYLIFYFEMIWVIIHSFLPYNKGDTGRALSLLTLACMYFSYSCNLGKNMIAACVTKLIVTIFIWPIVLKNQDGVNQIIGKILDALILFGICLLFSLIVSYIK